jgi:hypothetical protein
LGLHAFDASDDTIHLSVLHRLRFRIPYTHNTGVGDLLPFRPQLFSANTLQGVG